MKWMTVPVLILVVLLSACGEVRPLPTTEMPAASPSREQELPVATKTPPATQPFSPTRAIPSVTPLPSIQASPYVPRPQGTPVRVDDLPVFQAVRDYIAGQQSISREKVILISHEAVTWPDSCLGLASSGEICLTLETPGYLAFFDTPNGQVEAHLDSSGRNFRLVPLQIP